VQKVDRETKGQKKASDRRCFEERVLVVSFWEDIPVVCGEVGPVTGGEMQEEGG
jgi:hypothetical protein